MKRHEEKHSAENIERRLNRLFATRATISTWGIQYRLCEVGPASLRLDPRLLQRKLSQLVNFPPPVDGLISNPELTSVVSAAAVKENLDAAVVLSKTVNDFEPHRLLEMFKPVLAPNAAQMIRLGQEANDQTIVSTFTVPAQNITGKSIIHGRVVRFWILNELSWLYPDDPRLWRLLLDGAHENTPLLIIARVISPLTFPLLKVLGARGCQYYSLLSASNPESAEVAAQSRLDLPPILPLHALRKHAIQKLLRSNLTVLSNSPISTESTERFRGAEQLAFGADPKSTLAAFRDWAGSSGLSWSPSWLGALDSLVE